ncbi:MAG TPA: efflux RND transporter periplasmic adaptor subunit, partial [Polyangiales bacterium]|nr:efflux RND transporter periplasmic adaptor subunit [Polyangiales bacterium]
MTRRVKLLRSPGLWLAALALIGALIAAWVRARGPQVPVLSPLRQNLEQHVVASGRVWVPTRISIASQLPGLVVVVGVIEGQHVQPGELLVQLDDSEARASVAQAQAGVTQASARVAQLRKVGAIVANQAYSQAETNLAQAEADYARSAQLAQTGAVSGAQLEQAERRVQIARAQKSSSEAQQLSAAPEGADSRVAWSALLQTQAQLTAAQARLAQTRISVPQAGVVLSRDVEPGDVVQPGRTLLTIAADSESKLVIHPDERNLATIQLGQRARASADAFPTEVFDAEIDYIAPSIDPERGSVEVRLRVIHPPAGLRPDMTVSVDLTVASVANALTLPSEAIHGAATAAPSVWVVRDDRVYVQP